VNPGHRGFKAFPEFRDYVDSKGLSAHKVLEARRENRGREGALVTMVMMAMTEIEDRADILEHRAYKANLGHKGKSAHKVNLECLGAILS